MKNKFIIPSYCIPFKTPVWFNNLNDVDQKYYILWKRDKVCQEKICLDLNLTAENSRQIQKRIGRVKTGSGDENIIGKHDCYIKWLNYAHNKYKSVTVINPRAGEKENDVVNDEIDLLNYSKLKMEYLSNDLNCEGHTAQTLSSQFMENISTDIILKNVSYKNVFVIHDPHDSSINELRYIIQLSPKIFILTLCDKSPQYDRTASFGKYGVKSIKDYKSVDKTIEHITSEFKTWGKLDVKCCDRVITKAGWVLVFETEKVKPVTVRRDLYRFVYETYVPRLYKSYKKAVAIDMIYDECKASLHIIKDEDQKEIKRNYIETLYDRFTIKVGDKVLPRIHPLYNKVILTPKTKSKVVIR